MWRYRTGTATGPLLTLWVAARNRSLVGLSRVAVAIIFLSAVATPGRTTPNVLLIISDDQAWTDYGFMGHPALQTPNLDRLALESLTFTRGYVPSSLCRPSLASIITGLYPHQHGIVGNDPADAALREPLIAHIDPVPTLPKLLARAGYWSHQSGKWWEGSYARGGFTHGLTQGFPQPGGRHGDAGLTIGREGLEPIYDFIREARASEKPFMVWYAPFLPHAPHTPPDRLLERYRDRAPSLPIAKYWAMCQWLDETCGELLRFLDTQSLRDDTIVVYVTDNGWINLADRPAYAPRSKRSPYDGGLRTPIMIRYPGHIAPRIVDGIAASSLDLAPTILNACGLQPTGAMAGINLLDERAVTARQAVMGEVFEHDVVDIEHPAASLQYRWIVKMPWKLIVPNPARVADEPVQLYDLIADPYERTNQAEAEAATRDELRTLLDQWYGAATAAAAAEEKLEN
jgi:arylsulfatase A-like enzyme